PGYYQLVVQAQNTCGTGPYYVESNLYVFDPRNLSIFPNPSTEETTLSIKSELRKGNFDEDSGWDLEVYTQGQLLKEKKTNLKGNSTKIQTAGWKEGVYIVRVHYKGELLTGKLVVKK